MRGQKPNDELSISLFDDYPLLTTKLYIPHQPSYLVTREHLMEKMSRAMHCKVTVVTSPPGFGKTTMVSQWILQGQAPVSWVSLDQGENDLLRFWTYVIAAINRICPGVGHKSFSLLKAISFSPEQMISWLINDLFNIPDPILLVLDDYHLIESDEVHRLVAFFIERMPSQIHLCILSRKQPPIPFGQLRVQGQLNEINLSELRFTGQEIATFWYRQTGDLPNETSLQLLSDRTEGWVAGIQLAVLSHLSGQQDALHHFKGDHRYVVDYLMEEVFDHLPEGIRSFLLKTSLLERMNAELCAELTGEPAYTGRLQEMEKLGLFVIPLDAEGKWFRYHHLFADFLRCRLHQHYPEEVISLHWAACEWFVKHNYLGEAIEHALAAGAFDKASEIILTIATELLKRRELTTLHRWLLQLPVPIRERPSILIIQIWTELFMGHQEQMGKHVKTLQKELDAPNSMNDSQYIGIREDMKVVKNFQAMLLGDYKQCYSLLNEMYEDENLPNIEGLPMLFGLGMELNDGTIPLIRSYYGYSGRIKKAERYHRFYGEFIDKNGFHAFPFTAYQRAALCEVYYEKNQLSAALQLAEDAIRIAKQNNVIGAYVPAMIVQSKIIWEREGKDEGIAIIHEALDYLKMTNQFHSHWHGLLQAFLTRCRLDNGEMDAVNHWMRMSPWSRRIEINGDQDFELLVYIQALLAKENGEEALSWCEQLLKKARNSSRIMTELEVLLVLSQIHGKMNNPHTSMIHLHQALILGEREGYLRIFIDRDIKPLLQQYADVRKNKYMIEVQADGVSIHYLQVVRSLSAEKRQTERGNSREASSVFMLTIREKEVLQLLGAGLSNKDIAEKLGLTQGTVKLHLHRVYSKLQVSGRTQAIQKANQHRLI
ncbi:hypothetical protein ASG89_11410 [Paenibacillus sp. Soil766]|uniref:LuxR C-terminal-related transcriptional regulator n=1 Tax=Paenibacillus sp. Soil766 TaxID=1736404 RepID=UPI00070D354F|nr:LuxR C-terminal-related transcriptional regulator [Paenibacillus sp. Soil766]KRE83726.1 hypothetical protein ASG89_11410 [Paenibacillus sp. Soil766]